VELCEHVKSSKELTESLVKVVETCLLENVEMGLPAAIYNQILARRAEFAFVIVRKLHRALPDADLFSHIFKIALKAIDSSPTEFRHALATADMDYYRSLLRIIYVSLTAAVKKEKHSLEFGQLVIDLLNLVVAQGFKDLVQGAHQYPERANPQDIALINAILQAALRIQDLHEIHHGLANHLHENQTIRAATTLFSWAEQLAGEDGDPVYGELAVLFLLELSSVPLIAEQLALENVLELLESTTLALRITQSGVTPLGESRLHAIWSRGMLPLALNLLANIGVRYGREIIGFLRFFRTQIKVAIEGWRKPSVLVLPAVNESVTIAMIIAIVTKMGGKAELATLGFEFQVVLDGVDYLLTHKNYLKSLVAPTTEEEEMMLAKGDEEGGLVDVIVNQLATLQALLQEDVEE
jgi:nuclear pore complex protein Nup188